MFYLITILIFSTFSYADYGGGYPGASMRMGSNAREISLSNSMVSISNPGFNSFTNPALLSTTSDIQFGNSLFLLSQDRNIQILSISRELPPNAGAGISIFRAGVNNIIGITSNEEIFGELGYNDIFTMLSFGVKFNQYASIGFNLKALFQNFKISDNEKYSSKGISLDLGMHTSPTSNVDLGVKVENILGNYNWNQKISDESQDYEEILPIRGVFGASYSFNPLMLLLTLQHEIIYVPSFNSMRSSIGVEYTVNYQVPINLRFGLKQNQWAIVEDSKLSFPFVVSSGIGFSKLNFMNKLKLNIDYAFQYTDLGFNNFFSISTQL